MSQANTSSYVGGELDLFAHARNWKNYWGSLIEPYLQGKVLEVGAGIGANTRLLRTEKQTEWVCLEPDAQLLKQIGSFFQSGGLNCELRQGTIGDIEATGKFDAILYIDVLEHIGDDVEEVKEAALRLKNGGRLVVLSPAHNWLFSPFDAAIGHHRRYTKKTLNAAVGKWLRQERLLYLDSCGLAASLCNRLLLRQSLPTLRQIHFWDRVLVPASRVVDPMIGYTGGKSVLGVWRKA